MTDLTQSDRNFMTQQTEDLLAADRREHPLKTFHIRSEITLQANDRSEALSLAATAVANWNDETGWQHIQGIGDPAGYVMVTEPDEPPLREAKGEGKETVGVVPLK